MAFGPRRRMVQPTSMNTVLLLNSATVDSAHASSGIISGGILRIVGSAHDLVDKKGNYNCTQKHICTCSHANKIIISNYYRAKSI